MDIHRILVTGRLYREMGEILSDSSPDREYRFIAEDQVTFADYDWADAFVAFKPAANFHFGQLKWIHALGAGVDAFLSLPNWKEDVVLTRTTGDFGQKIGEYCLSYILADSQHHALFRRQQSDTLWKQAVPTPSNRLVAVVYGTGSVGRQVAKVLSLLNVTVYGVSLSGTPHPHFQHVCKPDEAAGLLAEADWVINTLPLTADTQGLFQETLFARMIQCGFINAGRGASVNEPALLQALQAGHVKCAVLDVFAEEPLRKESALWSHPGVIVTPHISAVTSTEEAVQTFICTLAEMERGNTDLPGLVDRTRGY
ncbi:D-2-hydroxyacid dehydrogenase [Paenibacillus thalictri]|uniref:D-2-hydroxyacid dehydrogenase n=1 Tax=Paenibacillus thalictri TaxID=2527873 RepID=A0A4Q9DVT7_9BACL|nr:D-2-hydroxyacid dehydrogenase [Paenibacillus thalictri]TBL80404.1 D-2-hydroxyacid dehydrogenase [Paenibacillus thalictri]